jgi:hypothetical protein
VSAVSQHATLPVAFSANDAVAHNNDPLIEIQNCTARSFRHPNQAKGFHKLRYILISPFGYRALISEMR